jgi:aminoglycoside phosphotransferase (APT) family kinase protein
MTARDHRLRWHELPDHLRAEVEGALGSAVVEAVSQRGGYGPSLASICLLADGRQVFVKAVSPAQNPDSPGMMRREAEIARRLPGGAPAPALLHEIGDGEWIALVFEHVEGRLPVTPWDPHELQRVVEATLELGDLVPPAPLGSVADYYGSVFVGWRTLAGEQSDAVADPWCRERLAELAEAEARWEDATAGDRLLHGDVRSDNVLLTTDGRVLFVDWTSTCTGAGWFDALAMLPAVALEGGGPPEHVMELVGLDLDSAQIIPLVAALAGFFIERGRLSDPPGLPTVRAFQRGQGEVTLAWLRRLWDRG